jgi:hypothetical protein
MSYGRKYLSLILFVLITSCVSKDVLVENRDIRVESKGKDVSKPVFRPNLKPVVKSATKPENEKEIKPSDSKLDAKPVPKPENGKEIKPSDSKPVAKPVSKPENYIKPSSSKPVAKPVSNSVNYITPSSSKPVAKPVSKPENYITPSSSKPVAKPLSNSENYIKPSSSKPVAKPISKPINKPVINPEKDCNHAIPSDTFYEDAKKGEIFMILSEDETNEVVSWMINSNPDLSLTPYDSASLNDNYVHKVTLAEPDKTQALAYIETGLNKPMRTARVVCLYIKYLTKVDFIKIN